MKFVVVLFYGAVVSGSLTPEQRVIESFLLPKWGGGEPPPHHCWHPPPSGQLRSDAPVVLLSRTSAVPSLGLRGIPSARFCFFGRSG